MSRIVLLIVGMAIVTYIPRLLPFLIVSGDELPKGVKRFLLFIPPTALGALILPEAFFATPNMPEASFIGIGFALVYAWYKGGIIVPVLGAVVATLVVMLIGI